ncbi:MAG: LPS export ABC transporter permease LptG [Arenicellales bacterium]|nr:LPS export ABC transporter permease LptG [Arenicellales bacterium]
MKLLSVYIARTILRQIATVTMVLLGLFLFVAFLDQLNDLGVNNYGILEVSHYLLLTVPRTLYELFPIIALLGTILGLSMLAGDSELTIMRASGVSLVQIVWAALKVGLAIAVVAVVIGEWLVPLSESSARKVKIEAMQADLDMGIESGVWLRDGQMYVNIREVLPNLSALDVNIYEFDQEGNLRAMAHARQAFFNMEGWRLEGVEQTLIEQDSAKGVDINSAAWSTVVTPQLLKVFLINPIEMPVWHLFRYIDHLQANDQETAEHELAFWFKVLLPLSTLVMVILAIPFVFRSQRSMGYGRSLFIGIVVALVFYALSKSFGYSVLVYGVSPFLGAVIPLLLFFIVASFLLHRAS